MKKYKFKVNEQTFEVEVADFDGNNTTINVNGSPYHIELLSDIRSCGNSKTPVLARKPVVNKPGEGEIIRKTGGETFKVASPLPGSIFNISVKVGDRVEVGDCLLVMEAMKMENNILSEKGGVITALNVKIGDSVLQGDILLEIG